MGNICCGNDESKKAPAVDDAQTDHESLASNNQFGFDGNGQQQQNATAYGASQQTTTANTPAAATALLSPGQQKQENERQEALEREQARLEIIIQAAGRNMVPTSKGNLPYYNDQGFAAALSQHLEQTTSFPKHLTRPLPAFPKRETLYARLSQGVEQLQGVDEKRVLDQAAESYLDSAVVTKERLFAGVKPIVENLI